MPKHFRRGLTIFALAMGFVGFAGPSPTAAKELPKPIRDEIRAARALCDGQFRMAGKFVSAIDFNRDRRPDYLLNYDHVRCGKASGDFCGSGGCLHQLFVSRPDGGYAKALDKNLLVIRFGTTDGRPSATIDLHGSECGKVGVAECREVLLWDGTALRKQP